MGRFPRKCKLRGPSRYPPGTLRVPCTFRRGLIWKIRKNSDFRKIPAKFGRNLAKICQMRRFKMRLLLLNSASTQTRTDMESRLDDSPELWRTNVNR